MTISTDSPALRTISDVARATGTTSRTLRHYHDLGIVVPAQQGSGGQRLYDDAALVRLQRVLLLRDLGLPLATIRTVLDASSGADVSAEANTGPDGPHTAGTRPTARGRATGPAGVGQQTGNPGTKPGPAELAALRTHLDLLRSEQERLARQVAAVTRTINTLEDGGNLMAADMFDGFDHTQYREEVEQRWGADAYAQSNTWWQSMSAEERSAFQQRTAALAQDWSQAASDGTAPDSPRAQELARRHVEWLGGIPGTPGAGTQPVKEYVTGLGEMYVADPRFAKNYGGSTGAVFVRDALRIFADQNL